MYVERLNPLASGGKVQLSMCVIIAMMYYSPLCPPLSDHPSNPAAMVSEPQRHTGDIWGQSEEFGAAYTRV